MAYVISGSEEAIRRCRDLAACTEEPGRITRTFLSAPVREAHRLLTRWMEGAGMSVRVDAAGNLRGLYPGTRPHCPVLYIGSHIDTVPDAGAFDGVLGVVLAIGLVEALERRALPFAIEVVAFSEEEGVRFGVPFIGSRALAGAVDSKLLDHRDASGKTVADAIRDFGLDPRDLREAKLLPNAFGYLEFHIEQGPILEQQNFPLGIVTSIAGQSRFEVSFEGQANHAGTTPTELRRDALAGAAEWIAAVESAAAHAPDLRATIGELEVRPGASNVIPGHVRATLDVRHADDAVRAQAVSSILSAGEGIARRRFLDFACRQRLDQPATPMDAQLTGMLERAVTRCEFPVFRMVSGAGHDAMIMARCCPAAMLFLRSPGGISHQPEETVLPQDVEAALAAGARFLSEAEAICG
jgi:allantoate deiminase